MKSPTRQTCKAKKAISQGIRRHLTTDQRASIVTARSYGASFVEIAKNMRCSVGAVHKICKNYEVHGRWTRKVGSGRKRKTTPRDDALIIREVQKNRRITGRQCQQAVGLTHCHERTVRRRISQLGGYNSYWATKKPYVNNKNRLKRLKWCKRYQGWTVEDWKQVLWSDESPFVLTFNRKFRVWRLHNERYNPMCCAATVKHDKKINVWGCFRYGQVGSLYRVEGILEQVQYRNILNDVMLPDAEKLFGDEPWLFQQDNDPKHTANTTKSWLEQNCAPVLDWPSQSPDLNPIENLWSILDHVTRHRRPQNEDELFTLLQTEWQRISTDTLKHLVESMPKRIAAVIANKGYATHF